MIPPAVERALAPLVGAVKGAQPVGGGCIANATRLDTSKGTFFLKHARGEAGRTFAAEAHGLRALRLAATGTALRIPEVVQAQDAGDAEGFLLMEWIEQGRSTPRWWEQLGEALAALHRAPAPAGPDGSTWGFAVDNFIGRLPQQNGWRASWPEFFAEQRLRPQLERARRSGHWLPEWSARAERLLAGLGDLLPAAPPPSVLHGDLWSGNVLAAADGRAALFDPATYVGHREADLAMTELFGGFDERFYAAYRAAWPPEPGYERRRDVYNLYHLLNHLNHFGGGYASGVDRALRAVT